MKEFKYVVNHPDGLATRGGSALVNTASSFSSTICMKNGTVSISAKSLLGVMILPTKLGEELTFTIEGPDEEAAMEAVQNCVKLYL